MINTSLGAPLEPINDLQASKGWQLVVTQWHKDRTTGQCANTPIPGATGGRVPFLTGEQMHAKIRGMLLHPKGGPECVGRYGKTAIRPPLNVVIFDVDHGYSSNSGTAKKAETPYQTPK